MLTWSFLIFPSFSEYDIFCRFNNHILIFCFLYFSQPLKICSKKSVALFKSKTYKLNKEKRKYYNRHLSWLLQIFKYFYAICHRIVPLDKYCTTTPYKNYPRRLNKNWNLTVSAVNGKEWHIIRVYVVFIMGKSRLEHVTKLRLFSHWRCFCKWRGLWPGHQRDQSLVSSGLIARLSWDAAP